MTLPWEHYAYVRDVSTFGVTLMERANNNIQWIQEYQNLLKAVKDSMKNKAVRDAFAGPYMAENGYRVDYRMVLHMSKQRCMVSGYKWRFFIFS